MQKAKVVGALAAMSMLFSGTAAAQQDTQAQERTWMQQGEASRPVNEAEAPIHPRTLKEAAQAAVLKNPEVLARWHAFNEAKEEIGVARGAFFPKVDVSAGTGRIKTRQSRIGLDTGWYRGSETTITLRQMIFDGFGTYNEVKRLGKAKLVRYFELLDASETVALEAARAYLDVVRYREHAKLAEDNYIQHYAAHEQLERRAASGVGKRVDVDQAASRLALADVNVTTAYSNLHDVTARYLRIVGENPPAEIIMPERVDIGFPPTEAAALQSALHLNPALRASIENVDAAQYDLQARRAAYYPRFDIVARRDHYSDYEDNGHRDESRIELRMNYNLFNGLSDISRDRQYRERKYIALDLREKACRDIRQTLAIAYNDTVRLKDQLAYLATQVDLVAKTRAAYRDQFNIGQRTLLDLLNTQNEYFDARRAQVNADIDLALAYLRSYAGIGRLLEVLAIKRIDLEDNQPDEN
ncbi:MAG: TolC family outer membrane protein, partial [Candidatus Accumulibacter sp.]|nr:TolC family outer membrane protein [Accumulibacter sp.]